ncbi:MAG: aminotransferase class I/II-fold pyridoxal phosphate-dependent enzyme [Gemmatimonadetes bacterium]|nr:aminotransferase class I/II-fold pyridoxal phosphate-dependent enzyme [Gemmatimonadota bacterium]
MSRVSRKSEQFTESVIREMTRLARKHDAVNLAQGFPDFAAPEPVKEAAVEAIRADVNQYAITWGAPNLREAIAEKAAWANGLRVDPERNVTVTCGSTEAMLSTLLALVDPGDEVIVFEPFYENYGPDAILCGATPRFVKLREPDWSLDERELAAAFGPRTRAIILNTPNNPTGKVFTREELETIADLCLRHDVIAITDEIYEHIVYDGAEHVSLGALPGMEDRCVTINALSKTYSVTGWRVGWAIACEELTNAIRKVHDFATVGAAAPLQEAGAHALRLPRDYYAGMAEAYRVKRDVLAAALTEAGFGVFRPRGAYYIMTDISGFGARDDVAFARYLVEEIGVAGVPGSSFYTDRHAGAQRLRFNFCKRPETLEAAIVRLERLRGRRIPATV